MCLTPYQRLRLLETRRITQQARTCGPERQESEMSFISRLWNSKTVWTGLISIGTGVVDVFFGGGFATGAKFIIGGAAMIFGRDAVAKVSDKIDKAQETMKKVNDVVDEVQAQRSPGGLETLEIKPKP
jgi:hypothetical protein